ncbi:MAG: ATP-binding protein [Calditrichia bacterium]
MPGKFSHLFSNFKKYHFELKHLLVLFMVLIFFLILVSFVHNSSLRNLLIKTQDWYQQDSAERLANLSATSLELLLETSSNADNTRTEEVQKIAQAFNIILSQPLLQQNVRDICILVSRGDQILAIDDGHVLFDYFYGNVTEIPSSQNDHSEAISLYRIVKQSLAENEQIYSIRRSGDTFHVFVPFVPKGEFLGAVYIKNTPDFTFITREIIASYDEIALIFTALILFGLLAMFYISSYTVKERNETQRMLFEEREKYLTEKINHDKELVFTKRIYHTHHKAEKVMGFIKEDLRNLSGENIEEVKYRVTKYANFISRVIYDMKWYDPPLQTIRNPIFRTNLNEVIRFIVRNLFLRISQDGRRFRFELELDDRLPAVSINEFVVWEVFEPLLQNCIDHAGDDGIIIQVMSCFEPESATARVVISDNGKGIPEDLLERNEKGVKKIFLENVSTKKENQNSGYGCYLAYEISRQRCGWYMDAENRESGGSCFTITLPRVN